MYRGSFGFQEGEENVRCAWSRIREGDPGLKRPAGATLREVPDETRGRWLRSAVGAGDCADGMMPPTVRPRTRANQRSFRKHPIVWG